jgi:hypothetical protein
MEQQQHHNMRRALLAKVIRFTIYRAPLMVFGSGMRLDEDWEYYGEYRISTPLQVFAPFTIVTGGTTELYFIFPNSTMTDPDEWTTTTYSNLTTISLGTASMNPLVVIWESSDLSKFPPAYASSVAKQIGIPFTLTASPGSSSNLPQQTSTPSQQPITASSSLSTGAKACIGISIGIILFIRRRCRNKPLTTPHPDTPEMDATLAPHKWYLGGRWRSEAEAQSEAGELDGRNVRIVPGPPVELDAGGRMGRGRAMGWWY